MFLNIATWDKVNHCMQHTTKHTDTLTDKHAHAWTQTRRHAQKNTHTCTHVCEPHLLGQLIYVMYVPVWWSPWVPCGGQWPCKRLAVIISARSDREALRIWDQGQALEDRGERQPLWGERNSRRNVSIPMGMKLCMVVDSIQNLSVRVTVNKQYFLSTCFSVLSIQTLRLSTKNGGGCV